jgi:hypothetical protein
MLHDYHQHCCCCCSWIVLHALLLLMLYLQLMQNKTCLSRMHFFPSKNPSKG